MCRVHVRICRNDSLFCILLLSLDTGAGVGEHWRSYGKGHKAIYWTFHIFYKMDRNYFHHFVLIDSFSNSILDNVITLFS
jgi:hypothetical protein